MREQPAMARASEVVRACAGGKETKEAEPELIEWAIIVTAAAFSRAALRPIRSIRLSLAIHSLLHSFLRLRAACAISLSIVFSYKPPRYALIQYCHGAGDA